MKISELIETLTQIKDKIGDIPCVNSEVEVIHTFNELLPTQKDVPMRCLQIC